MPNLPLMSRPTNLTMTTKKNLTCLNSVNSNNANLNNVNLNSVRYLMTCENYGSNVNGAS